MAVDLKPIDLMLARVKASKDDSDTTYFSELLLLGEFVVKLVVASLVAAVQEEPDRHRYRQMHSLVRADGLGDWDSALQDVLAGPASQFLVDAAKVEQRELTERCVGGTWQYDAVRSLNATFEALGVTTEPLPGRVAAKQWFAQLARLRNETKGHGAYKPGVLSGAGPLLGLSIDQIVENFHLFRRPWVHLHRNLSGKYRVTALNSEAQGREEFNRYKNDSTITTPDGVYVLFDRPVPLSLLQTDADCSDFLLPNGGFSGKTFELLSYLSGSKVAIDASPYLAPATDLPQSETQGLGSLEILGACYSNLPPAPNDYVARPEYERNVLDVLSDDRHPVVTLSGRGGIGKTWLALSVLRKLAATGKFEAILWFSARDIDLLQQGPKLVRPAVLSLADIARTLVAMVEPGEARDARFDREAYLGKALSTPLFGPTLFVVDNFETVRNPDELYKWLDTFIRLPNKLLITTRVARDFRADYPVDIGGMSDAECNTLIDQMSLYLNIKDLLTNEYREELIKESSGHPYVIKVFLGEVAKAGKVIKVERIAAAKEDILDALFERTFASLSPSATRCLLTLANWRSSVSVIALEAVLLRPSNERMDVESALDELRRSSFIEVSRSPADGSEFVALPLAAYVFARRKLQASPMKFAIEADTEFLRQFGAETGDLTRGVEPRVSRLFGTAAQAISSSEDKLSEYLPILEFVAGRFPPAWLLLSKLYEESGVADGVSKAKDYVRRYLEVAPAADPARRDAWVRLASLSRLDNDVAAEVHALVELSRTPGTDLGTISNSANQLNNLLRDAKLLGESQLESEEKSIAIRGLAQLMENRLSEATATDCSRLAWLYLHLHEEDRARELAQRGLSLEPGNWYCLGLADRLGL